MTPRRQRAASVAMLAMAIAASGAIAGAQTPDEEMSYRFRYERPGEPTVAIELSWTRPLPVATALVMPRAIPMGYGEQRYDAFVSDVRAFATGGAPAVASRAEGPRWTLPAGTTPGVVSRQPPANGA